MANMDAPFGLQPKDQSCIPTRYWAASDAGPFYQGGVVQSDAGVIAAATASSTKVLGVVAYHVPAAKPTESSPDYDEASVAGASLRKAVYIYDDPNEIFKIQSDGSIAGADAYIGANFTCVNASTGNTTTLQSTAELDASSANYIEDRTATGLRMLRCVGVADIIGRRDYNLNNPVVEVKFNQEYHVHTKGGSLT